MINLEMRLHSHPHMERQCNVPDDHVIIDRNVYEALLYDYSLYVIASESCGGRHDGGGGKVNQVALSSDQIEALFLRTDFGGSEKTDIGRRGLMCECVLKRASGYRCGHTIETICKTAGLLRASGTPSNGAIRWVYEQMYHAGCGTTLLERLHGTAKEASNG